MNDDFGIGVSGEDMTASLQLGTQLGKIINLAVEDNPNRLVFIEDRLVPTLQVDDAEPTHAQTNASLYKDPLVVGPAVHDGLPHPGIAGRVPAPAGLTLT